jgi:hypothetical protein
MTNNQLAAILTAINAVETRCRANSYLIAEILKKGGATPQSLEKLDSHLMDAENAKVLATCKERLHILLPDLPSDFFSDFGSN